MTKRVEDSVKSECQSVMDWIGVQTLPDPKGCKLTDGVFLCERKQTYEGKILNDTDR